MCGLSAIKAVMVFAFIFVPTVLSCPACGMSSILHRTLNVINKWSPYSDIGDHTHLASPLSQTILNTTVPNNVTQFSFLFGLHRFTKHTKHTTHLTKKILFSLNSVQKSVLLFRIQKIVTCG